MRPVKTKMCEDMACICIYEWKRWEGRERERHFHIQFLASDHWANRVNMELENSHQPVARSHPL